MPKPIPSRPAGSGPVTVNEYEYDGQGKATLQRSYVVDASAYNQGLGKPVPEAAGDGGEADEADEPFVAGE